jgi:hypothetical protein
VWGRATIKRAHPEDDECIALVQHIELRKRPGLVYWHVPNEGKRGRAWAGRLKAMGLRSGVSDYIFLRHGRVFALEYKREKGRPTTEQMTFILDFEAAGGFGAVVYGIDQALAKLVAWDLLT